MCSCLFDDVGASICKYASSCFLKPHIRCGTAHSNREDCMTTTVVEEPYEKQRSSTQSNQHETYLRSSNCEVLWVLVLLAPNGIPLSIAALKPNTALRKPYSSSRTCGIERFKCNDCKRQEGRKPDSKRQEGRKKT
eukprot:3494406-Amphidinium_carterae.1